MKNLIPNIFFLFLSLCIFAQNKSQFLDDSSTFRDNGLIKEDRGSVIRDSTGLFLKFKNGKNKRFDNIIGDFEIDFTFCGDINNFYILGEEIGSVNLQYYILVDKSNGDSTEIKANPYFSPNGRWVLSARPCITCTNAQFQNILEIWENVRGKLMKRWSCIPTKENFEPRNSKWISNTEISFIKFRYGNDKMYETSMHIVFENGSWKMIEK